MNKKRIFPHHKNLLSTEPIYSDIDDEMYEDYNTYDIPPIDEEPYYDIEEEEEYMARRAPAQKREYFL